MNLQEVSHRRANVWASRGGAGGVTLSTHLDTVPPYVGPRLEGDRLFGRGACDAKGIAAAMMVAAEELALEGEHRVDLLLLVGEEKGSDGARAANRLPATSKWLVNGEPTERPRSKTMKLELCCSGSGDSMPGTRYLKFCPT